ncbi:translation initiation factor IF-2-like [Chiroxiphia lanceolata]|uniref:translation initiation factor IF-2-like n=1 Tax=Chiroxiphia lanceolata TaxID=296741 RepID=UPI0013CF3F37|nr:translation initiation factor IF-2-like [Chiroxiphia lanceolata]
MVPGSPGTAAQGEAGRRSSRGGPARSEADGRSSPPRPQLISELPARTGAGRRRARASARPPANGGAPPRPAPRRPAPAATRAPAAQGYRRRGASPLPCARPLPPRPPAAAAAGTNPGTPDIPRHGPGLAARVPRSSGRPKLPLPLAAKEAGWEAGWVRRSGIPLAAEALLCGSSRSLSASLFSQARLFLFVVLPREKTKPSSGEDAGGGVGPGSGCWTPLSAACQGRQVRSGPPGPCPPRSSLKRCSVETIRAAQLQLKQFIPRKFSTEIKAWDFLKKKAMWRTLDDSTMARGKRKEAEVKKNGVKISNCRKKGTLRELSSLIDAGGFPSIFACLH